MISVFDVRGHVKAVLVCPVLESTARRVPSVGPIEGQVFALVGGPVGALLGCWEDADPGGKVSWLDGALILES